MSLKDKVIFMSGGSRGIGLAMAKRAAQDGAKIVVAAKTADPHPKCSTTLLIASLTLSSSLISHNTGSASPPASIISSAAVYIVPGSFGCGSAVFAATTILVE